MSTAFLIGAAALALGAVIVALFLPARARDFCGPVLLPGTAIVRTRPRCLADTTDWEPTERVTEAPAVWLPAPDPEPR